MARKQGIDTMSDHNRLKDITVNVDVTDVLKSVNIMLRDVPKTITTASRAVIDQIDATTIVETLTEDIIDVEQTPGPGRVDNLKLKYVEELLGNNYYSIYSLLVVRVTGALSEFVDADVACCKDIIASSFGTLCLTLTVFTDE
jgi:hypothetical protein